VTAKLVYGDAQYIKLAEMDLFPAPTQSDKPQSTELAHEEEDDTSCKAPDSALQERSLYI
jgi:hypothetical protein